MPPTRDPSEPKPSSEVSMCLVALGDGDETAIDRLLPYIYDDLRRLAGRIHPAGQGQHTLQPTALVHEAYVRLVDSSKRDYNGRQHFMRVAALAMRQLLANYATMRKAEKRGGVRDQVALDDNMALETVSGQTDLVALHEALTDLRQVNERQASVVELRFLVGLSVEEAAEALGVSERTVKLDWQLARRFLNDALRTEP